MVEEKKMPNAKAVPAMEAVDALQDEIVPSQTTVFSRSALKEIERSIPGLTIAFVENAPHWTSEGVLQGYAYFFRYRHGTATLRVGDAPLERPLYQSQVKIESEAQPTVELFSELMKQLVEALDTAPFLYVFKGRRVHFEGTLKELKVIPSNEIEHFRSWGHSAEEAFRKIAEPSQELAKVGLTLEIQREIFELQEVQAEPLTEDTRVFPKKKPAFRVVA